MFTKPAKCMYQTECRNPSGEGECKRWNEDISTGVFRNREDAIESCLELVNQYPGWQYRVVRFDRVQVEVFK